MPRSFLLIGGVILFAGPALASIQVTETNITIDSARGEGRESGAW